MAMFQETIAQLEAGIHKNGLAPKLAKPTRLSIRSQPYRRLSIKLSIDPTTKSNNLYMSSGSTISGM